MPGKQVIPSAEKGLHSLLKQRSERRTPMCKLAIVTWCQSHLSSRWSQTRGTVTTRSWQQAIGICGTGGRSKYRLWSRRGVENEQVTSEWLHLCVVTENYSCCVAVRGIETLHRESGHRQLQLQLTSLWFLSVSFSLRINTSICWVSAFSSNTASILSVSSCFRRAFLTALLEHINVVVQKLCLTINMSTYTFFKHHL